MARMGRHRVIVVMIPDGTISLRIFLLVTTQPIREYSLPCVSGSPCAELHAYIRKDTFQSYVFLQGTKMDTERRQRKMSTGQQIPISRLRLPHLAQLP